MSELILVWMETRGGGSSFALFDSLDAAMAFARVQAESMNRFDDLREEPYYSGNCKLNLVCGESDSVTVLVCPKMGAEFS